MGVITGGAAPPPSVPRVAARGDARPTVLWGKERQNDSLVGRASPASRFVIVGHVDPTGTARPSSCDRETHSETSRDLFAMRYSRRKRSTISSTAE